MIKSIILLLLLSINCFSSENSSRLILISPNQITDEERVSETEKYILKKEINNPLVWVEAAINIELMIDAAKPPRHYHELILLRHMIATHLTGYQKVVVESEVKYIKRVIHNMDLLEHGPLWMRKGRHQ
jgi:hypothetical protein